MKLSPTLGVTPVPTQALNWSLPQIKPEPQLKASTWVKLRELPNPYSHDEALLLCQHSDTQWIVWIPEHGEMVLHHSQFGNPQL